MSAPASVFVGLGPAPDEFSASELLEPDSCQAGARACYKTRLTQTISGGEVPELMETLAGTSPLIQKVRQLILRVAPTDSTVLINGESGTGKELAARAIHRNSRRAGGPFVAFNCAALTETLLESELLGHEKGSFTGALALKKGRFELADGGTIFLDEIGCMAFNLQAKLLRVLEDRRFQRVGGTRTIQADVRVIAATNSNLEQAVLQGAFREDLYYRLKVITIVMPPLREHKEDIPTLVNRFSWEVGQKNGHRMIKVSPEALSLLLKHDWPGNVRELRNVVEHAYVFSSNDVVRPDDLPETLRRGPVLTLDPSPGYRPALEEARKQIILNAFIQSGGNRTRAAGILGVHPNNLSRLVRKMDIKETVRRISQTVSTNH
jgi:transcriptional regulator with PAS, ATPase and Fis domain